MGIDEMKDFVPKEDKPKGKVQEYIEKKKNKELEEEQAENQKKDK